MKPLLRDEQQIETVGILKKVVPFDLLDQNVLENLTAKAEMRKFPRGTYVFRQGDPSLHLLFIIISGSAEILIINEQDEEVLIGKRQALEFFGQTVFFSDAPYPISMRAEEDLVCFVITNDLFETELAHITEFTSAFSRILAERTRVVYQILLSDLSDMKQDRLTIEQPMRKRVANLMSSPPVTCRPQDDIAALAKQMTTRSISSLVVVNDAGLPLGIITNRDLVEKVLARDDYLSKRLTAADIMSKNLLTAAPEAFYYEALLLMIQNKVKHLVVIENHKPVGIVTIRDLAISRSVGALSIVKSIEMQDSLTGLAKASVEIDQVLQALVAERATSKEILQIVTEFFDRLTRKVIQVCEQEMIAEGHGLPPVAYGWLTMGSSGRHEQFVKTDQDNAIIYENVAADREEEVANYFHLLAEKVVEGLYRCGFAKCKGNVMASNPFWCRSLNGWYDVIHGWINKLEPENVRMMTIFLDFRHVYGKKALCDQLRNFVTRNFQKSSAVLLFLVKDDLSYRVPLNFFKQIITEKTKDNRNLVNLKRAACIHVIDCIRIFSLREGIEETNTFKRLDILTEKNIFSIEDAEIFEAAYEKLMMMRIEQSLLQLSRGEEPDNNIYPHELRKRDRAALRKAFMAVEQLQNLTGHAFYATFG